MIRYHTTGMKSIIALTMLAAVSMSVSVAFLSKNADATSNIELTARHFMNILKHELGEATLQQIKESKELIEQWSTVSALQSKDKIILYLLDSLPVSVDAASLRNYGSSELVPLLTAADIVSQVSNASMAHAVTIVNLMGRNITDIQQLIAESEAFLGGKNISHIAIAANPNEHNWVLNFAAPRRLVHCL